MNRDHSVVFEIALKYCISDPFLDHGGYFISSKGFLPAVVDIMVIRIKFTHSQPFLSTDFWDVNVHSAISCLTTSNLPWFTDLTFQVPMQYCSLQHRTLLLSPFSRGISNPRDQTQVSCIAGRFFTVWATREPHVKRGRGSKGFFTLLLTPKNSQTLHWAQWAEKKTTRRDTFRAAQSYAWPGLWVE